MKAKTKATAKKVKAATRVKTPRKATTTHATTAKATTTKATTATKAKAKRRVPGGYSPQLAGTGVMKGKTRRGIRVVTFDLDDTLWDVGPVLRRAEAAQNRWLKRHRPRVLQQFDAEALHAFRVAAHRRHPHLTHQISKIRVQALYELQMHCGYNEAQARRGADAAFNAFLKVRHQVEPYERALEVLEELARYYLLGALSNGNADIHQTDIGECFDFAFSAEQLNASKPLPDMFRAAMRKTSAAPNEVVHVGDSPQHDVAGAGKVGMHTVWMNPQGAPWPGRQRPPDESISDLEQLPEAIRRIERRMLGGEP